MNTTKKLPVAIRLPSGRTGRNFLVPRFSPEPVTGFVDINTGKVHAHRMLVYLGVPISAQDILDRFSESLPLPAGKLECLELLDQYVKALQSFKLGNIISIEYSKAGEFLIKKVQDMPPVKPLSLPG